MTVFAPNRHKVHSLTGRITPALLRAAWQAVRRNRGAAGIDRVSLDMFAANLADNLRALERDLKDGSFQPLPLRRHYIPKGGGKFRPLGIPAVRDRVAQEGLRRLLSPVFEPKFHDASFGFRPGRNCHQAIARALEGHEAGDQFGLDADIVGFFDNLPHSVIMAAWAAEVADGNILRRIEKFLRAGVMEHGVCKPTTVGTPQGGVVSPLLANLVLNHLDWQLHQHGYRLVRYADDFVVLTPSVAQAKEALNLVTLTLATLGLKLRPEKTQITTLGKGYSLLGFVLCRGSRRMRPQSVEKLKEKVRELTQRHHNLDADAIKKLNQVIRGTALYFAPAWATTRWQFRSLDSGIRMRVRAMWHKCKRYTDNYRLPNKKLERLGLLSLLSFCATRPQS
jgi:group II intron reverse transcriptase/maturase